MRGRDRWRDTEEEIDYVMLRTLMINCNSLNLNPYLPMVFLGLVLFNAGNVIEKKKHT